MIDVKTCLRHHDSAWQSMANQFNRAASSPFNMLAQIVTRLWSSQATASGVTPGRHGNRFVVGNKSSQTMAAHFGHRFYSHASATLFNILCCCTIWLQLLIFAGINIRMASIKNVLCFMSDRFSIVNVKTGALNLDACLIPPPSSVCQTVLQTAATTTAVQSTQPQGYKTLRKWAPCPQTMCHRSPATHQNPTSHPEGRRSRTATLQAPANNIIPNIAIAPPTRKPARENIREKRPLGSCSRRRMTKEVTATIPTGLTVAATAHLTKGPTGHAVQKIT